METEKFDFYDKTNLKSYDLDAKLRYQLTMLDSLDNFTRRHCENVATITCNLCRYLHLEAGFTVYCITCAYLHDLGKIAVPPEILQKPSKLTDEEFEIMKSHTTIGYKMCMKDPALRPYAAGAYYHHEALNGTGYPNKLTYKDIPYEAQIIRVADEYEAITSKRQYKSHIGIVDTLKILIENSNPSPNQQKSAFSKISRLGKIDKTILKALFKVVIDDIEYEIYAKSEYLKHLEEEVARLKEANKFYIEMNKQTSESKKEYFKNGVLVLLKPQESIENVSEIYKEYTEALDLKKQQIAKLNEEITQIKHLRV